MSGSVEGESPETRSDNVVWHSGELERTERWKSLGVQGAVVWLTGLSGSGKSTVAAAAERMLIEAGQPTVRLDGDNLRHGLCGDLGFSPDDRKENIRRVSEAAVLFAEAGVVALVPIISPYLESRQNAREIAAKADIDFFECFVDTPLEECERRDPKGLYKSARAGEITGFTGIDDPYEAPENPDLRLTPADGDPETQAQLLVASAGLAAAAAAAPRRR